MYWNHRVVDLGEDDEQFLVICEVFYNDRDEPVGYTEATVGSETLRGIQETLSRMASALKHDILTQDDFYPPTVN